MMKIRETSFLTMPKYDVFFEKGDGSPARFLYSYNDLREAKRMAKVNMRASKDISLCVIQKKTTTYIYLSRDMEAK